MTIILGDVCSNTCLGYQPGDNTPDYLALFGPTFGELTGHFELDIGAAGYALTINGHTLTFGFADPHYSISFTNPLLSSFAPGAFVFTATGTNAFGIAVAETEFLCPSVPEPATALLLVIGFAGIFAAFNKRRAT
jgi:PEP-CTERM motif